ncbi:RNA-directed DNA polymerase, eukaryota, partial [Tanacetum coccineum]
MFISADSIKSFLLIVQVAFLLIMFLLVMWNSEDPFKIYDILNKKKKVAETIVSDTSIPFPPGFTPNIESPKEDEQHLNMDTVHSPCKSSGCSSRIMESSQKINEELHAEGYQNVVKNREGGSILELLEEMITVGQTMGFSMEGCNKDMEKIIGSQGDNKVNGESIIMGDFNEVRRKEERWGSTFNAHGARVFNNFISNAGLVDLQLEGFSFTWSHPSALKMSKLDRFLVTDGLISSFPHISAVCLDRHLSDHRPILLREVAELEIPISKEEIRNAVWGCGENKSPGPDGFTFEFFRKYWHIVGTDFCLAVEWVFNHDSFSVGCNSSFIALIPKSLDPKL